VVEAGLSRVCARTLPLIALALGLGGCSAAGTTAVTATGHTLAIYLSAPAGATANGQIEDVLDAEALAFEQKRSEVTAFNLKLVRVQSAKLSDNARRAIEDSSAIAYLGEIVPGASGDTLGITNAQDLLQVSPTDTAVELTQPTPAVSKAPDRYYESLKTYGRTFARVVPTSVVEAKAQVRLMRSLSVKSLYLTDDGSAYGKAIAQAVRQDAATQSISIASGQPGATATFYGARSPNGLSQSVSGPSFGPSALAFVPASALGSGTLYISTPASSSRRLPAGARQFLSAFRSRYGHVPSPQAIFGYEAMAAVLDVLHQAGTAANDRSTVVHDFFAIRNRPSVVGTYSIDVNGDTSLSSFVFTRLRAGRLVPLG
jgi:branched-chain amino acid transport system substrate-binding protein